MSFRSIACVSLLMWWIAATSLFFQEAQSRRKHNLVAGELPFLGGEGPRWFDKNPSFNAVQESPQGILRADWAYFNGDEETLARWMPVIEDLSGKSFNAEDFNNSYAPPGTTIQASVIRLFWSDGFVKRVEVQVSYNCLEYFVSERRQGANVDDPEKSERTAYSAVRMISHGVVDNQDAWRVIIARPKDRKNGHLVQCGKLGLSGQRIQFLNRIELSKLNCSEHSSGFTCNTGLFLIPVNLAAVVDGISTKYNFEDLRKLFDAQSRMSERPRHRIRDFDFFQHAIPGEQNSIILVDVSSSSLKKAESSLVQKTSREGVAPSNLGLLVGGILAPAVLSLIAACFELTAFLTSRQTNFVFWIILTIGILAAILSIAFAGIELPKFGNCKTAEIVSASEPRLLHRSQTNETTTINFFVVTEMVQKECTTKKGISVVKASVAIVCFDILVDVVIICLVVAPYIRRICP